MALERNNTALEFETMLQHHLKQSGATGGKCAGACSGFDADVASAYIENALSEKSRADYELHLADCSACRHHLVGFTRLLQSENLSPVALVDRQPTWKSTVSGIKDQFRNLLSIGHLNWQTASLVAGAAAAMLITALAIQSFMQTARQTAPSKEISMVAEPQIIASDNSTNSTASPDDKTSEPLNDAAQNTGEIASDVSIANFAQQKNSIPSPVVKPQLNSSSQFLTGESLTNNQAVRSGPAEMQFMKTPVAGASNTNRSNSASIQMPAVGNSGLTQTLVPNSASAEEAMKVGHDFRAPAITEDEVARNEISSRINVSPGDNPMRTVAARSSAHRTTAKETLQIEKPVWRDRVMGFVPFKKDDGAKPEKMVIEEDSLRAMKIRIRDRIFRFENGMWVDQEYKPEMAWRVTKLVRGSDEFQRILTEDPLLKPYFDKGSITVIWGDKIYKVVGK